MDLDKLQDVLLEEEIEALSKADEQLYGQLSNRFGVDVQAMVQHLRTPLVHDGVSPIDLLRFDNRDIIDLVLQSAESKQSRHPFNEMEYPGVLLRKSMEIYPILGTQMKSKPFALDLSINNTNLQDMDLLDQQSFQQYIEETFHGYEWGLSEYLEYREPLLKHIPQMAAEKRYYHLGLDILAPKDTKLYAPIDATIYKSEYEEGKGNYGGFVVLKHIGDFETFYSLYGHLDVQSLPQVGTTFAKGEPFALMGNFDCNGDWFYHTHLQIFTQMGLNEGWISKGYCSEQDIDTIDTLCPNPHYLFCLNQSQ